MILTAFWLYLHQHLAKSYRPVQLLEYTIAFLWIPLAMRIPMLFDYDSSDVSIPTWKFIALYLVIVPLLILMKNLICALVFGLNFFDYDVIYSHYGYRATHFNLEEQEYNAQYVSILRIERDEYIVASAILDSKGEIWAVMKPGRHHHCIAYMAQCGQMDYEGEEGFMTNQLRFFDREDARRLAFDTFQVRTTAHPTQLFSEDLWGTPTHLIPKA